MLLKDLLAKRAALNDEMAPLLAKDKSDTEELTDEETERFGELVPELEGVKAELDAKQAAKLARAQSHEFLADQQAAAVPARPTGRAVQSLGGTTEPKLLLEDDPKKGFAKSRDFFQDVLSASRPGHGHEVRNKEGMSLLQHGGELMATVGSDEQREGSDPKGGFLVPEAFSPNLLQIAPEDDPIGGRTTTIPMAVPQVSVPVRVDKDHSSSVSGGLTVTRKPETAAATASTQTYEQVVLNAHKLVGLTYVTDELMSDSPISVAALLSAGFSDEFNSVLIKERIAGAGVGEMEGVMSSGCLITVTKETGQAAATIAYENIIKMRARSWGYQNAIWLANHDTIPQLMLMNQSVGTGGIPVWQPSAREDHPDILLGRPLIFTEYVQSIGTKGDILLGTWSEYLEGVLQPLESAESMHVRFVNGENAFRFTMRNAGAPWWRSALTPDNGSTLSPFVTLAARA